MKKPLVIFGTTDIAQLAHFYFSAGSEYEVVAFTADAQFCTDEKFCSLPIVPFEEVHRFYAPDECDLFVAIGYSELNSIRKKKYLESKALGYRMASYISPNATVLNNGCIGDNCFIFENNTIQPFVTIGNNVVLWSGNHIGHHSVIKDHCFIASHAVISGGVEIDEQCFIGVNATIRDHIKIGSKSVIGAGTLLLSDAPPESIYIGLATERSRVPSTRLRGI